jgi:hypothetical protein
VSDLQPPVDQWTHNTHTVQTYRAYAVYIVDPLFLLAQSDVWTEIQIYVCALYMDVHNHMYIHNNLVDECVLLGGICMFITIGSIDAFWSSVGFHTVSFFLDKC